MTMAVRTNLAPGGGEDGEGQPPAAHDLRGWTCKGMVVVLTLVLTNL